MLAGLALAALLAGCSPRPRAPALMQGEALYVNAQEGFRFVPPPNWALHARAEWPAGRIEEERLLVAYRRVAGNQVTRFEVTMVDVAESVELAELIVAHSDGWKPEGRVEALEIAGRPAARGAYRSRTANPPEIKEIVAVRKGERVYFFIGLFAADDSKGRDQVRKSIETLSW
jgi:hypothetical protein